MADKEHIENLQAWSDIVIERWRKRISRLKINDTRALSRSFQVMVEKDANGDPEKITFTFLYYGKFVDMGVGKDTNLSQRGQTNRKAKPWYTTGFRKEISKLAGIMAEKYGGEVVSMIKMLEMSQQVLKGMNDVNSKK